METSNTAYSRSAATSQREEAVTFDQVYNRHWKPLYRTAFRILKDEQAAEDIVQDTFVRLWENWDTILHINIKGWLFTTSYHLVLKNLKQLQANESLEQASFPEPLAGEADEPIRTRQLQLQLETCVDNLPEQCRRVYTMSKREEFSIKRIATELNISPKTVEYHVTTALRRIRQGIGRATLFLLFFYL
ncbi:RNA polymerase sigma-70 factor [Chitinophaga oryzae]|uniref:RNA polymerase sigma-70 factor n=1 Tax=Chitinophaga oryzae TaxID=2725414 RepID=A0AAE6ZBY5_9BACT|nr:RNA polymerase sigma-70 factor [Chitinophaga oryzae]QJB30153.1 RNA polymerase sigma-70 factor [Chitinophaga oryzae]QJB36651.1 RNA polymerase sigma-70 factor [Chitinophaga oryzae]